MKSGKLSMVLRHCRTLANDGATVLSVVGMQGVRTLLVNQLRSGRVKGKLIVIVARTKTGFTSGRSAIECQSSAGSQGLHRCNRSRSSRRNKGGDERRY